MRYCFVHLCQANDLCVARRVFGFAIQEYALNKKKSFLTLHGLSTFTIDLPTSMTSNPDRSEQARRHAEVNKMLAEFNASHQITLAFHKHYNLVTATARVTKWYHIVMRQLFGRNWAALPRHQRIEFLLLPEVAEHLHFHGVIRIPNSHLTYFTKIAAAKWKCLVPTSTLFWGDFYSDRPREHYFKYITKNSLAVNEFVHSLLLPLPGVIPDLPNGNSTTTNSK